MTEDQRTQLPPQYAPGEVEARRYGEWVAKGLSEPAEVVAKTRDRLEGAQADIGRLTGRLAALPRDDA